MSRWLSSVVGLALVVHIASLDAERPASVRLVEVRSESTAASQSVLITATEPASYAASQPDPLTVLITLRDVAAGDVVTRLRPGPDDPVTSVEVLDAVNDDGTPVTQVRIGLRELTVYEVRSRRQTIQVRFARPVASTSTPAPENDAPAPPLVGRRRSATAILSVGVEVEPHAISVTLHGNGALSPSLIHEAEHLPPRLFIDFPYLAIEAASLTPVEVDPVTQVRVTSPSPELTRVALDLVRPAVHHIEHLGGEDQLVRVVFPRDPAVDPAARIGPDPASETATAWPVDAVAERLAQPDALGAAPLAPLTVVARPVDITALAPVTQLTGLVAVGVDGSPLLHPDLGDVPRPSVWEGREIARLEGPVAFIADTALLLKPAPGDVPSHVWPEIPRLEGPVAFIADMALLLKPAPGDVPSHVWPEIPRLEGPVAFIADMALLLRPAPGDVPSRVWPEIPRLEGPVAFIADMALLLRPAPGDVPSHVWPEIPRLEGPVAFIADMALLLRPAPGDVPSRVWPEIPRLEGSAAFIADTALLLKPAPGDVPSHVWPEIPRLEGPVAFVADTALLPRPAPGDVPSRVWPEISRLEGTSAVLDVATVPLLHPDPLDLSSRLVDAALSVTSPAVVAGVSTAETELGPAAVAAVEAPAAVVEPTLVVTPVAPAGALETPAVPGAVPGATEQFLPLRGLSRPTGAPGGRAAIQLPGQTATGQQEYTGDPISMDFQNIDLRAVLRVFAEISALNIVIDPSVQGEVNVALTQVPWDQAFAIILRANGLDYEVDGTVVRIASVQRLQQEAQDRSLLAQREAEAGELVLLTRTLSYARAADLVPLITSTTLSPRGEVFTDARTNTLIIRDLADRLTSVSDLLDTLDRAEPQVEIEARIVQAGHDSARALGVQWGVTGRVAQEIGNTLPFSFPNRGGVTGRAGGADGQGPSGLDPRALPDENAATVVNLGVGAATSALGLTLGSVNGALNLDVVLSALESEGELSIISSPRVMTQNNVQAEILQGDQIPYQTVANNTVTVQFKEAALTLRVTPQITAANTVIMQVELENSFADFGRALGDPPIPSIVTQRAMTTVQVADGQTTVIGGIFENTQSQRNNRTPLLHRVPLLGWLFKSTDRSESSDELMIFITPRIVQ